jgi:hypothetical protein
MSGDQAMRQAAALFAAGRLDESLAACQAILRTQPSHFYALHLASTIAYKRGALPECIALATRALEQRPDYVEVLANRGAALRRLNHVAEALADYDRALAAGVPTANLLVNRGIALVELNRNAEATAQYERAIALDPKHAGARFHRSLNRLLLGDLKGGFEDYEWRWTGNEAVAPPTPVAGPRWTGAEDLRGKTLFLYSEQGFGDAIQFARYAAPLAERGARVLLEVHPPLKELLASVPGVAGITAIGEPRPAFDYQCPLLSVPFACGTTLETVPARVPYIHVDDALSARWRARLAGMPRPRVGLVWSGSRLHDGDGKRSIPFAQLAPVVAACGTPVSLQKDVRETDASALAAQARVVALGDEIADFRDTAAIVGELDVVVTVDTAVAHLAGALGRPAWVMLPSSPDWRWMLDRPDSPWYPTARLFRQPAPGDWTSAIARVAAELGELK